MTTTEKIIDFAMLMSLKSEIQIEEYDKFNNYIEPLFLKKFDTKFEPSLLSYYGSDKKTFLIWHKAHFNKNLKRLFYIYSKQCGSVINNKSQELDDTINAEDEKQIFDDACMFTEQEAHEFLKQFQSNEQLIIKPFFLI